jgi:hypothetical protein
MASTAYIKTQNHYRDLLVPMVPSSSYTLTASMSMSLTHWSAYVGVPSTVDNSTTYTIRLTDSLNDLPVGYPNGRVYVDYSYTTDASATQAELETGLTAAVNAGSHFRAVADTSNHRVWLWARYLFREYSLTSPTNATTTNDLTIGSVTNNSTVFQAPFGANEIWVHCPSGKFYITLDGSILGSNNGFVLDDVLPLVKIPVGPAINVVALGAASNYVTWQFFNNRLYTARWG